MAAAPGGHSGCAPARRSSAAGFLLLTRPVLAVRLRPRNLPAFIPMKAFPWLCGLSPAANLAFVAHTAFPRRRSRGGRRQIRLPTRARPPEPSHGPASTRLCPCRYLLGQGARRHRSSRHARCPRSLRTHRGRRQCHLRTRIRDSQKAAREAIDKRPGPQETTWWYQDETARNEFEETRGAERKVLNDELTQTLASLFGPEPASPQSERIHDQAKFPPESKRLAVSRILSDYEAMEREGRTKNNYGAELLSDQEKRRFIAEERRNELAAVLSPEELRAYDLRHSQTAQNLRWQLGAMKPTLEEYQAIFDARRDVDSRFDTNSPGEKPNDFWQKRQEAEAAAYARLRQTPGEEPYIDYALSNDYGSRQVDTAAERYGLPKDTTRQLWKLRQEAGREGEAVYDDKELSRDEKRALLADLARRYREQTSRYLTADALSDLKGNNYIGWIDSRGKGNVTVFNELGNSSSGYGL